LTGVAASNAPVAAPAPAVAPAEALAAREAALARREAELAAKERSLATREAALDARERALKGKNNVIDDVAALNAMKIAGARGGLPTVNVDLRCAAGDEKMDGHVPAHTWGAPGV
jgi:hypothetical protein